MGWGFLETLANANTSYTAGTGSGNAGDTYSFGATGSTERALGGLRSGTLAPILGAAFTNNTGATITSLSISYTGEQWRLGTAGRNDRLDFQYSTNATNLNNGTYTDVNTLDFTGPISTGATGALDGNAATNRVAISGVINGLGIASGATFFIRWNDADVTGADDGLAIDDFSLTASGTVADAAPTVNSTVPTNGAVNVASNSDISITFSEPVNVSGNWFQIACGASGTRQVADTLVSGGPTTYVINPNLDFAPSEQCTVTVVGADVSDQDTDDPPDVMTSNPSFSYTIANPPVDPSSWRLVRSTDAGGNSGATYRNDFIEIINRTGAPINLSGWTVQYGSATGSTWQATPLSGTLAPGQYYLIQESSQAAGGTVLPTPDATGSIQMAAAAGKVALVIGTALH